VGDSLVAFDEHPAPGRARRYRAATVEKLDRAIAPLFRVTLQSGKQFDVTADHRWLIRNYGNTQYLWATTGDLIPGKSHALRLADEWDEVHTKEAGWLAGMYDGEGCLSKPNRKQGGLSLSLAQRPGIVLDRAKKAILDLGFEFTVNEGPSVQSIRIGGPSCEKLKLLGMVRPERLIAKFSAENLGRLQAPDGMGNDTVVSVEAIGDGEIVLIQTSTGTMIVEGYAHHNCHYFPNPFSGKPIGGTIVSRLNNIGSSFTQGHQQGFLYASKQYPDHVKHGLVCGRFYLESEHYRAQDVQRSEWNGIVVKNGVGDFGPGTYDLMPLSMKYLSERYS
jgi:hypothetical protein